jgi:hypothetical protein
MANARLRKTVKVNNIDLQTMRYLTNLEKRIKLYTIRFTNLEYQALQDEATEAEKSMAEIIRLRLWRSEKKDLRNISGEPSVDPAH